MGYSSPFPGERNLFGLAPGGVYQATPIAQSTGELLPHLFTLTHRGSRLEGGIFSVALSLPCEIRALLTLERETSACLSHHMN